jgi:EmrB/QacA subfamily drug resistance transporter
MISETKWLRVIAIIPSAAMSFMDQTILPVALPVIQRELGAPSSSLAWTVNAYFLGLTAFVLIGGKLGDRIGHRKCYLLGIILFALFSALCGLSQDVSFLIFARALQGVGAGIMFPAQTSLIATSFPPQSRGQATGIVISIGSLFAVLGPFIGGILTELLSWRWIFWVNIPITAIGIVLIFALLPASLKRPGKVDFLGFIYFAIFALFATIFFMQAQNWGWLSAKILISALIALVALIFLFKREKISSHPFLEIALLKRPLFAAIALSISITQFILMITVFRTVYIEEILGYTPTQAGMITSASCVPILFFSYLGGFLSDKVSPKLPIALGYLFLLASFFWLGFTPTPSLPSYFVATLLFGMGIPFVLTPSYSMAMSTIPKEKLGVAFGLVATLRNFAGTMGLALIYLFVDVDQQINLPKMGKRLAEISSFSSVHFLLGVLLIIAFIAIFMLHRRKSRHHPPDAPAEGWD